MKRILTAFVVLAAATPVSAQQVFPSDAAIQAMLEDRIAAGTVPGIVVGILAADGTQRFVAAGSSGTGRPLDSRTVFEIGSISKAFTGVLLAEMGQIDIAVESVAPPHRNPTALKPKPNRGVRMHITGEFDVDLKPLDSYAQGSEGVALGRMSLDKTFRGDLAATSQGEMLSAMTPVKGSAGYVAIEQVVGTLQGKAGTFVLQHFGLMNAGQSRLLLEVVPDSGTGELTGLSGTMAIEVKDGKHHYQFEYAMS